MAVSWFFGFCRRTDTRSGIMADREHKGLVARWLEGKERSEDYARSTLPTNRFSLFWDILKGRFGRLMLVNLLVLITFLPTIAIFLWRYLAINTDLIIGPYGSSFLFGYPSVPDATGLMEYIRLNQDFVFFALLFPAGAIAALGISGGMYIIRNLIWTEGVFVANDFLRGIRRNYLNVLEAVLVFVLFLFLAQTSSNLADMQVALGSKYSGWMIASKTVGYILLVLILLVCLWMISLGINYKQGAWALFRNALVMAVGTFPQTVVFAVAALFPVVFFFFGIPIFFAIGLIFYLLIGFSYAMLVWMDYSQWAFDKFVNPNLGVSTGRGLYNKETQTVNRGEKDKPAEDSAAMREYRRMIVAQGKSKLVSRPIKPIDDDLDIYQLPDSFSREDLQKLKESKQVIADDVKRYEEEHKNDEQYVEYNRQFEERERALREGDESKKKKKKRPPKMLNKR